jgi:hypothetical protein
MAGPRRRQRGRVAALAAAALCLIVPLLASPTTAAGLPLPAGLRITSITDSSHHPALPLPVANDSFNVAFQVVDSAGNIVRSPNVLVALKPLNGSGLLLALPVLSNNGRGVVHAIYTAPFDGLHLKLSAVGLLPATATLDVSAGGDGNGLPGISLTLTAGDISLSTGLAVANLPNGANGPATLTIGPCVPDPSLSCTGVLTEIELAGNFKDADGNPLYSDSDPASVSWTCNEQTCPPPADFVPGSSTQTQLQVEEFQDHPMYVSLRNKDGTFQPFTLAPACNGIDGAPLPTGTINPQDTGGLQFCVDVGAISRADEQCQTTCSSWSGPLTLPVLFVEDPRFASP